MTNDERKQIDKKQNNKRRKKVDRQKITDLERNSTVRQLMSDQNKSRQTKKKKK